MKLERPLVVLDLETTGVWIDRDKIIEIGMIRCLPDGSRTTYEQRVNPGMPIPPAVTEVTGISDVDVREAPPFRDISADVMRFLEGADLAGFNAERFDLPVLARELSDAGIKFDWRQRRTFDAQKIYHLKERRDLTAAYAFYCHKDLTDAHSALADSAATLEVLAAQAERYGGGREDIDVLGGFEYKNFDDFYDADRKLRWWNGELYMMFGKYARKLSLREVAARDRAYLEWIMAQNFNDQVKEAVEMTLEGHSPQYPGKKSA